MGQGVPDAGSTLGTPVVHANAACTDSRAPVYTGFVAAKLNENRRGTGGLGGEADLVTAAWLGKTGRRAGKTKITKVTVTGGVPPAKPRAGNRRRGFRARAARCGEPDAEGVSSTTGNVEFPSLRSPGAGTETRSRGCEAPDRTNHRTPNRTLLLSRRALRPAHALGVCRE